MSVRCSLESTITTLGHDTHVCVGASNVEQWLAGGHGRALWCVVVCWIVLWSRRISSHRIEYKDTWWYAVTYGVKKWALGVFPPRRLMGMDVIFTIRSSSRWTDGDVVENLGKTCSLETNL